MNVGKTLNIFSLITIETTNKPKTVKSKILEAVVVSAWDSAEDSNHKSMRSFEVTNSPTMVVANAEQETRRVIYMY